MTRSVFDNSMTAHVWSAQTQDSGRSSNGQFYFSGPYLYSYGSHYIVGVIDAAGRAWLNSTGYSMTTNRHQSEARSAVRGKESFYVPDLTRIATDIRQATVAGRAADAPLRARLVAFLNQHIGIVSDETGAALYALACPGRSYAAHKARTLAGIDRDKAREAARLKRESRELAATIAKTPLRVWRAQCLDSLERYNQFRLTEKIRTAALAHKAAGGKLIKAAVWKRLKAARSILKAADSLMERLEQRKALSVWKRLAAGDYSGGPAAYAALFGRCSFWLNLRGYADKILACHMPPATRARLVAIRDYAAATGDAIDARERRVAELQNLRAGRRRTVKQLRAYAAGLRDAQASGNLQAFGLNWSATGPWAALGSVAREAAAMPLQSATRAHMAALAAFADAQYNELQSEKDKARIEAARIRAERLALPLSERVTLWQTSGESLDACGLSRSAETETGGAYVRAIDARVDGCKVTGGTLQTSQGADVPLAHAFRLFLFVKGLRDANRPSGYVWSAGRARPSHIRVGHFSVDWINGNGDFKAGCHRINWSEIQALARLLGVDDCAADVTDELEAAA